MLITLTGLLLGLLQGIRHAFEPDHLAAVSTLVADRRAGRTPSYWLGLAWGLGHTVTLLLAGGALFLLRAEIPAWLEHVFELVVAAMLVVLGARAARRAFAESRHTSDHDHAHPHAAPRSDRWLALRPLAIGLVHGLAGSGALTALVLARLDSVAAGVAFMALFGIGSMVGMAALTGLLGWPLARVSRRGRALPILLGATGGLSLVVGLGWGWIEASRIWGA